MSESNQATALPLPQSRNEEALRLLETRRSVGAAGLTTPGPAPEEIDRLLAIAIRVPDHAILTPWRFILIEGEARTALGARLAHAYRTGNPQMEAAKREKFAGIMSRLFPAPLAVVVVSRPNRATMIPPMEQELSAGAACMNLLHGASALGFSGIWVTGWAANDAEARRLIGLSDEERVAGIVHIGTARETPLDRPRADPATVVSRWNAPEGD